MVNISALYLGPSFEPQISESHAFLPFLKEIITTVQTCSRAWGSVVVKALRSPVVSLGIFSMVPSEKTMCPEVDSASENEYQGFLLG
jgi:hypothetical protein